MRHAALMQRRQGQGRAADDAAGLGGRQTLATQQQLIHALSPQVLHDQEPIGRQIDDLETALQVRVLDRAVDLQLRRQGRPLPRILSRRSRQKLKHDRMLRRHVDGPEHARQSAAFEAIVQFVIPVQERPGASGHQHHRLVSRQHAAGDQPFGQRAGVALSQGPFDLAKTGHQLLALLGGHQLAVRQQLPELRNGCSHIASEPPQGGDAWSKRQAGLSAQGRVGKSMSVISLRESTSFRGAKGEHTGPDLPISVPHPLTRAASADALPRLA